MISFCLLESEKGITKEGKPMFTAGMMLKRRQTFKSRLLGRVMDQHKVGIYVGFFGVFFYIDLIFFPLCEITYF